ncbi:hemagglutinin [Caballeronia hypogeia]|uniref:Hemagglutinin n=1 Tax=Caballeronia hypogeia TaxID=1777140 RepID=A0A158DKE3_9BURK|nr:YadA-like family protein [Caballeronia hypogeia]SAK95102.1 hemagglutinin [Caballeronia hypogeia]
MSSPMKAAALNGSSTDAVNGSQLYTTNQNLTALSDSAVKYDSSNHDLISLGNTGTPVQVTNVKAAALNDSSTDAVNGAQLYAVQQSMAGLASDAVMYDSAKHDVVTFGKPGTPVQLTNVKAGALTATSSDAVNGAQLYATNQAVAKNTTDISNLSTTVNNWTNDVETGQVGLVRQDLTTRNLTIGAATDGASINVAGTSGSRVVTGVANGAVNATSTDAINGSQLYAASAATAAALGGGAGVDANGVVTAPAYTVGGTTVNNVGAAIENLDGRVTKNTSDIATLQGGLADVTAVANNAVAYDSTDHKKVTLGGEAAAGGSAPAPVQLTNVKNAELSATSTDAVNGGQLFATNTKLDKYAGIVDGYQQAGVGYVAVNSSSAPRPVASGTDAIAIGAGTVAAGNNSIALGANASAKGNNAIALGSNSVADQDNTVSVGSAGNERRVTNVAPGTGGTDAVNMNQMNAMRNDFGSSMTSLQRSSFAGVAAAMAMPLFTPREPGHTVVSASVGTYKGYSALGLGVTYRARNGGLLVNGALAVTPYGDTGARASVAYDF